MQRTIGRAFKDTSPRGFITPQSTTFLRTGVSTGWRLSEEDCREAKKKFRFLSYILCCLKRRLDKNKEAVV